MNTKQMFVKKVTLPDRKGGRLDVSSLTRIEQIATYVKHGLRGNCNLYEDHIPEVEVAYGATGEGRITLRLEMPEGTWSITIAKSDGEDLDGY